MSLIAFVHHRAETPAVLGSILHRYGHRLRTVRLYNGDPVPHDLTDVDGVISMGGPMNVDQVEEFPCLGQEMVYLRLAHAARVPIVGVCLGAQLIAAALGGDVSSMAQPQIGWYPIRLGFAGTTDPLLAGTGWSSVQFHIHGQEVTRLPDNAVVLADSDACKIQAFKVGSTTYAFQHHFEWDRRDLEVVVRDPFVAQSQVSGQEILRQADRNYDAYRRLGDRLCHRIAMNLFPFNKRSRR